MKGSEAGESAKQECQPLGAHFSIGQAITQKRQHGTTKTELNEEERSLRGKKRETIKLAAVSYP